MTRRRTRVKPSAALDWRALAAPPDQRRLALPVAAGGDDVGDVDDDAELAVRRGSDGRRRVVLIVSVTWTDPAAVRELADALHDAADALDAPDDSDA